MDLGGGTTGGAADSPPGSGEPTHPPAGTGSGPPAPPAENTITVQTPNGPEQMTEAEYRRRIEQAKEYVRQRVKEAATRGVTKAQLEQEAARQFGLDNNWSRMQGRGRRVIQTVTGELRELTPEEYHELTNRARDYVETRLNNPNNKLSREQARAGGGRGIQSRQELVGQYPYRQQQSTPRRRRRTGQQRRRQQGRIGSKPRRQASSRQNPKLPGPRGNRSSKNKRTSEEAAKKMPWKPRNSSNRARAGQGQ